MQGVRMVTYQGLGPGLSGLCTFIAWDGAMVPVRACHPDLLAGPWARGTLDKASVPHLLQYMTGQGEQDHGSLG